MNTTSGPPGTSNNIEEHCPVLYAQGLFIQGFGKAFFRKHFDWLLRNDPEFGTDSYGQTARLYVERVFVMHNEFEELVNEDKWKEHTAFAPFIEALDSIPDLKNKKHIDKNFFIAAPTIFFDKYNQMFVKHVSTIMRTNEILVYMVGGDPTLAKHLLQWLWAADNGEDMASYVFPSETITLKHQGASDDTAIQIDTRECLKYLTAKADPHTILEDPLINDHKQLWWKMANADGTVDLFDEATWNGEKFEPLLDLVHQLIVIHALHQQRCENHVQLAALVASTNVGEDRRTWRAIILSCIMRIFNKKALDAKRAKEPDPKKKLKIKRVEGAERIEEYADHCDARNSVIDEEWTPEDDVNMNKLLNYLSGSENKTSGDDLEQTKGKFERGLNKARKITKSEVNQNGADMTNEMGGTVKLSALLVAHNAQIEAELTARGIELPKPFKDMKQTEKKDLLRKDEATAIAAADKAREGIAVKDIIEITPVSDELIALMDSWNRTLEETLTLQN